MRKSIFILLTLFSLTIFAEDFSITPKININTLTILPGAGGGFNADYSLTENLDIELDANANYYFTQLLWDDSICNLWIIPITLGVKYNLNKTFALFGSAGISITHFESDFASNLETMFSEMFNNNESTEAYVSKYNYIDVAVNLGCEINFENNLLLRPRIDLVILTEEFYILPFIKLELGYRFDF